MFYGFKQMHPGDLPNGKCVYSRHIGERDEHEADQEIKVIPLRRLDRIIVSWERREKDLSELKDRLDRLLSKYDPQNPYYIPIDSPDRDRYWDIMNTDLNLEIVPQWCVISEKDSMNATFDDIKDKDTAQELINEYSGFFSRFY